MLDLLVAVGVFLYNLPIVSTYTSDPLRYAAVLAVSCGLCLPWLLRRRYPLGVNAVMLAAAWAQLPLEAPIIAADVMLVLAVYNTATRYRWRISVPAAVAAVVWLLVVVAPRRDDLFMSVDGLAFSVMLVAWVWTWGTLVRIRRDYIKGLQERASQLEREREARARIAVADERARITRETPRHRLAQPQRRRGDGRRRRIQSGGRARAREVRDDQCARHRPVRAGGHAADAGRAPRRRNPARGPRSPAWRSSTG